MVKLLPSWLVLKNPRIRRIIIGKNEDAIDEECIQRDFGRYEVQSSSHTLAINEVI